MKQYAHRIGAFTATLCIATFFLSTLFVEIFGSIESIVLIKKLIVVPGLFILVPAIIITGVTGFALSTKNSKGIIGQKRKRMPFIGLNGVIVLIPAAILLNQWASVGVFDTKFYVVQVAELVAGAINLTLMALNIRDGRRITHKKRV